MSLRSDLLAPPFCVSLSSQEPLGELSVPSHVKVHSSDHSSVVLVWKSHQEYLDFLQSPLGARFLSKVQRDSLALSVAA